MYVCMYVYLYVHVCTVYCGILSVFICACQNNTYNYMEGVDRVLAFVSHLRYKKCFIFVSLYLFLYIYMCVYVFHNTLQCNV